MRKLVAVMVLLTMFACSAQRKLSRQFIGKNISEIEAELGEAKTVFERGDEKVYVFEKTAELRSTEINQAKLTLDPMVTPKVIKTERYFVTVQNDRVTKIETENDYER